MKTEAPKKKRGRPPGRSAKGEATRQALYDVAVRLIAERGFEATTMRAIAAEAGVSPGLMYRYFPHKRAVVLALYDTLSGQLARDAARMPSGTWRVRFAWALEASLGVLRPHRETLKHLVPVLVADGDAGLFADRTSFARQRVQGVFVDAVVGASDAPSGPTAAALGRVLYMAHLGAILWWLLDRSPQQRATEGLVELVGRLTPLASMALKLPGARGVIAQVDELVRAGLFGEDADGSADGGHPGDG